MSSNVEAATSSSAALRELDLVPCQVRRRSLTAQTAAGPIPDLVGRDFSAKPRKTTAN